MEKKLSLQDYDAFYKSALLARQHVYLNVPNTIGRLDEYQQICRVCGCPNDGHFVDLDKYQEFEFEPSICSYRMLFQRASLQFQFHTMPDLPACICGTCAYKAKIFFLLTRQFLIGQQVMRGAVTDFYRDNYGIEPPEQMEDLLQLRKQLALIPKGRATPFKAKTNKELIRTCGGKRPGKLKRSASEDSRLNAAPGTFNVRANDQTSNITNRRKPNMNCQLTRSTVNLRHQPNKSPSPVKKVSPIQQGSVIAAPRIQASRRERNVTLKGSGQTECIVTPRVTAKFGRIEEPLYKTHTALTKLPEICPAEVPAQKPNVPPSKAQLQKKLQDRRKQWR
ncbi:uncharacterized protein LOC115765931 [Drosophila novamexicana]|uniref:uncharacterized protein LOC115765931 n=1 Tax=Drosophila novamexicana TaxID=47314 RepID=UPI0011E5E705|nr:uncharacterized protein LOC115765931 [Drosophila novamexicana]